MHGPILQDPTVMVLLLDGIEFSAVYVDVL
jgi:hypothetical protein